MKRSDFGDDFTWGVASAAFQIEGAPAADGKAPSIWDELARTGRIAGKGGDQGIDFYHRYPDDIDLIKDLGFGANRISLSWPRLMGTGREALNAKGADFYDRVIDATLAAGMEPWVTVHHWDLPLALWNEGGWARRGIVEDFARFAEVCAERFGDRVKKWMVFNEPASVAGHLMVGMYGRRGLHPNATLRSVHHINLACAEAGRRMRSTLSDDAEIGTTNVMSVAYPYEPTDERTARRKRAIEALAIDIHLDPAGGRGYPFEASRLLNLMKRHIEDGDLESARFSYDFMGVQCYGPLVALRRVPGVGAVPTMTVPGAEARVSSAIGIPQDADALLWTFRKYADHPVAKRMVVTEGGLGARPPGCGRPGARRHPHLGVSAEPGGGPRSPSGGHRGGRLLCVVVRRQRRMGARASAALRHRVHRLRRRLPPRSEGFGPVVSTIVDHRRRSRLTPSNR
ncbi:MAG: family 1 glycosylhydrolase [Ilumatobacteraceae bacterium]